MNDDRPAPLPVPVIAVIATGGTIASQRGGDGASTPSLAGQALLDRLHGLPPVRLHAIDLFARDSSTLTLADMQTVSDAVGQQLADPQIAGVVVLHGTDSMEETALLVSLQHGDAAPVVFTGAQFTDDHPNADGPTNISAAIRAALDGTPGVRLAFGGRLLPAWALYKHCTDAADAFRSNADQMPDATSLPGSVADTRIDIVAIHPGATDTHIRASMAAGVQGIVLAALGSGNASPAITAAVADCTAAGIPVVLSSRVPVGQLAASYGGGGGGHDLVAAGAILSARLRPGQARILLAALIASDRLSQDGAHLFAI